MQIVRGSEKNLTSFPNSSKILISTIISPNWTASLFSSWTSWIVSIDMREICKLLIESLFELGNEIVVKISSLLLKGISLSNIISLLVMLKTFVSQFGQDIWFGWEDIAIFGNVCVLDTVGVCEWAIGTGGTILLKCNVLLTEFENVSAGIETEALWEFEREFINEPVEDRLINIDSDANEVGVFEIVSIIVDCVMVLMDDGVFEAVSVFDFVGIEVGVEVTLGVEVGDKVGVIVDVDVRVDVGVDVNVWVVVEETLTLILLLSLADILVLAIFPVGETVLEGGKIVLCVLVLVEVLLLVLLCDSTIGEKLGVSEVVFVLVLDLLEVGVKVGVLLDVLDGVFVFEVVLLFVCVPVCVPVWVFVGVGVLLLVDVPVWVWVGVKVEVGVRVLDLDGVEEGVVSLAPFVEVGIFVAVGLKVDVGVPVPLGVPVEVLVEVGELVFVCVLDGVGVFVGVGDLVEVTELDSVRVVVVDWEVEGVFVGVFVLESEFVGVWVSLFVGVPVPLGVPVLLEVPVEVGVLVFVGVFDEVSVLVVVGELVGVTEFDWVRVVVVDWEVEGVFVGVFVLESEFVGVWVSLFVGVPVPLGVPVLLEVLVEVGVPVFVGVFDGVGVFVGVGVFDGVVEGVLWIHCNVRPVKPKDSESILEAAITTIVACPTEALDNTKSLQKVCFRFNLSKAKEDPGLTSHISSEQGPPCP